MKNIVKRITPPTICIKLYYQPYGSSTLIVDNYELNEYEFRQFQLDYAKGLELDGYTLRDACWIAGDVVGQFNADGSLTKTIPEGILDVADDLALELFLLKNKKRLQE